MGDQLRTVHVSTCILSVLFYSFTFFLVLFDDYMRTGKRRDIYFILTIKKSLMYVCWKKNVAQLSRGYYLRPIKFIAQNAHGGRTKTKQDFSSANDFAFFPFLRKILSKQCHR